MKISIFIFLFLSQQLLAEVKQENSIDVGIGLSPTFTPESGYKESKLRIGIEASMCFFKYESGSWTSLEKVTAPRTTMRLVRVGGVYVDNQFAVLFSPISILVKDKAYLSPSIALGKSPYTLFSFSYELSP